MPSPLTVVNRQAYRRRELLRDATTRDFSGGWNVADSDLNLSSKFAVRLTNIHRSVDGANEVRPGTKLFSDTNAYIDEIIHIVYYTAALICVGKNGVLVSVDAVGTVKVIWNTEIANQLSGGPTGWSVDLEYASSSVFNGNMIVCNGIDKPLTINSSLIVTYLNDLSNGSNVNVPICKFVASHGRYLLMAGDPLADDLLYISSTDTPIWFGDDAPNDAVNISLGSRVTQGSQTITGLSKFRTSFAVTFADVLLPGNLGTFDGTDHVPAFTDAIENNGSISHKSIQVIGESMLFCDASGVTSIERTLFTGNVKAERYSQLIDPQLQADLDFVNDTNVLQNRVFSIYDSQHSNYMLFVPDNGDKDSIRHTRCFVLKKNDALKIEAWGDWQGWSFRCGCRSSDKRIFMCEGTEVYLLGELRTRGVARRTKKANEEFPRDRMGKEETFDDRLGFSDNTGWTPVTNFADSGVPIPFDWVLPWSDNGSRNSVKNSRYIAFDAEGDQSFNVDMFVDGVFDDRTFLGEGFLDSTAAVAQFFDDNTGWEKETLDPALSMEMHANESNGYGRDQFGRNYGGGRITRLAKLYSWVAKYKLYKLRIHGLAYKPLKFTSITISYTEGSIRI